MNTITSKNEIFTRIKELFPLDFNTNQLPVILESLLKIMNNDLVDGPDASRFNGSCCKSGFEEFKEKYSITTKKDLVNLLIQSLDYSERKNFDIILEKLQNRRWDNQDRNIK